MLEHYVIRWETSPLQSTSPLRWGISPLQYYSVKPGLLKSCNSCNIHGKGLGRDGCFCKVVSTVGSAIGCGRLTTVLAIWSWRRYWFQESSVTETEMSRSIHLDLVLAVG